MALLLCLVGVTAALAQGCLHCHSKFSEKFSFYRHHVNLKSWWVGDIPVSGALLTDWSDDTMKELHLAIPAEITREKLDQVATAVYQRMDQLYQGKMYFPEYFPNELRNIFREQVHLIQNAIIETPGGAGSIATPSPGVFSISHWGSPWGPLSSGPWTHIYENQAASTVSAAVASSSTRPSPATTAQTRTSPALAITASPRSSGSQLSRAC
ncbi:izumo sperm-egg fusion protein 4 isoform X3 [Piliocolobus tephrosceles]|uniref:IZUMO family member 4 n=1 Tax=Piliocolobus tephrosceles TaxID=591936 RepID=A0A8C9GA43_9PRIM|nr:izumo sperm-egg fusion protein 4 isoform X3 [Piliocolobus tephrosceles]